MEFDIQTIGYIVGALVVIIAGLFVGFWLFGIAIVCSVIFGGYLYYQNINEEKMEKIKQQEVKTEIEQLKNKIIESTKETPKE